MPFDPATFNALVRHGEVSAQPFEQFDAFWKAFNHYYESLFTPEDGGHIDEWRLIHRAIETVPSTAYFPILNGPALRQLARISPVFNERIWNRFGKRDTDRHHRVRNAIREIETGAQPEVEHLKAVADLLYVIRCNLDHGFKTPDRPRDTEVLSAAAPILERLVRSLPAGSAKERGAA